MKLRNKKTGKIYTARSMWFNESIDDLEKTEWKTLKEFCEDWEDAKEPLIKDPKIRKAVRAWAEANGITNIYCYQYKRTCEFACENLVLDRYATIRFIGDDIIDISLNSGTYTITELCGEEEDDEQ